MSDPGVEILIHGRRAAPPRLEDEGQRVPAKNVALWAGVTLRTIDRWLADREMAFPKPIRINNRRYWRLGDLLAWEKARAAEAA